MKKALVVWLCQLLIVSTATIFAQNKADLCKYKVVPLNKSSENTTNILAGVANIRLKNASFNRIAQQTINSDYKVIDCYLSDLNKVSKQAARFSQYSKAQQAKILELEEVLSRTFIVEFNENISIQSFCKKLIQKYPEIELAEPYYVSHFCGVPNDPDVNKQTLLSIIEAFDAWDICQGSGDVLIGIGDSGCNLQHKDFEDTATFAYNINEIAQNGIDDDNNGYVDDYRGYNFAWLADGGMNYYDFVYNSTNNHGLQVTGIVGARTDNAFGIAGVGNKCKIVPMKICEIGSNDAVYGSQSILYAATRGCKVLNCSWGNTWAYSYSDQAIVDYATACGVSIVAAAGNRSNDSYCTFYPASYYGVLGVGGVDNNDYLNLSNYVVGTAMRVTAPAEKGYSLAGEVDVKQLGLGSSYAAPVVAGIIGILRSYRPSLNAIEANEIVRMASVPIRNKNNNNGFISPRVNMLKTLEFDYENIPSIILKELYYENVNGIRTERFNKEDTATLVLNVINILGDAKDIKLSLTPLYFADPTAFTLLSDTNNIGTIDKLAKNEEFTIKLHFVVNNPSNIKKAFYLLNMTGLDNNSNNFKDDFKFQMRLSDNITTLRNDSLVVSVSDNGYIGHETVSSNVIDGNGFEHIKHGSFLNSSGFLAVAGNNNNQNIVSTIFSNDNNFQPLEGVFDDNNSYRNVVVDTKLDASKRIGLEVTNLYSFPTSSSNALKIKILAKNISGGFLNNFSMGQFYDWDINNSVYNYAEYFEEGIPNFLSTKYAAAEVAYDEHKSVFVGSLAFVDPADYKNSIVSPQATNATWKYYSDNKQRQIDAISNGVSAQTQESTDINYIVGMQYPNGLKNNEIAECIVCTGIGKTKEELANTLAECARTEVSIKYISQNNDYDIKFINEHILIMQSEVSKYHFATLNIYNLLGEKILEKNIAELTSDIDMSEYPNGVYFIKLQHINSNGSTPQLEIIIK